jgi:protein phosphatase
VAWALAIDALRDHAPKHPEPVALARAVQSANQAVITGIEKGVGREGMGTTMTAVMIDAGRAVFAQVGDSRAYLLRNRKLSQVTEDHSVVAAMMRSGHLTAEEARRHPQRSVITRALGSDPNMNVDTFDITILRGDRLLICTDGLTTMVDDAHIQEILISSLDPNHAAEKLVQAALAAGGSDNISVIVVDVSEEQGANGAALAAMKRKKPRSKLWLWSLSWIILVAAVAVGVFYASMHYVENRAYLSRGSSGVIYLHQGLPGTILDFDLTFDTLPTVVEFDLLAPEYQAKIELEPTYENVAAALAELETMVRRSPLYFDRADELIEGGLLRAGTAGSSNALPPTAEERDDIYYPFETDEANAEDESP